VVRAAARLASQLNADWHAIYIETPSLQRLPATRRETILATLNLAQNLGATTAVIASPEVAESVVAYARKHNLSKLVIGRDPARRLWPWQRSSGQKLALLAPDIDLIEIGRQEDQASSSIKPVVVPEGMGQPTESRRRKSSACGMCGRRLPAVASRCCPRPWCSISTARISWRFIILTVVLVGMRLGRGPAALAAVLSVAPSISFSCRRASPLPSAMCSTC
jgi:two-component system sensor histidine kinase KdpD